MNTAMKISSALFFSLCLAACSDDEGGTDAPPGDTTAPSIIDVEITPEVARAGTVINVIVELSEAVASSSVTLGEGGAALTAVSSTGARYELSYTAAGTETEGTVVLQGRFTDAAGNVAELGLGPVILDFTAPQVSGINVLGSGYVRNGGTGSFTVSVSEAVGAVATAELADSTALDFTGTGGVTSFAYTADGTEGDGTTASVTVTVSDLAGNETTAGPFDAFTYDFTPPALSGTAEVEFNTASLTDHDPVSVRFAATEPNLGLPSVSLRNGDASANVPVSAGTTPNSFVAERDVRTGAPFEVGLWAFWTTLVDRAGNEVEVELGEVDLTP
jgi:hypothetical protein